MSINIKNANKILKKYNNDEDDEVVKKIKVLRDGKAVTFSIDMIDDEIPVRVDSLGGRKYEITKGKDGAKTKAKSKSFRTVLKKLMDTLKVERDKKIEYYASMDTPMGETPFTPSETPFSPDDVGGMFPDEEEGESPVDPDGMMLDKAIEQEVVFRESSYDILTPRQLISKQDSSVVKISEKMFVTKAGAKIILRAYRWNVEKVMNTFIEHGKKRVLRDVGLLSTSLKFEKKNNNNITDVDLVNDEFECPSCYDDVDYKETLKLDSCGHRFCTDCWKEHLTVKIKDGLSKRILCMGAGCPCAVDEIIVSRYITDPNVKKKYDTKVLESFVEDNDHLKWCQSAPHCGNAVMVKVPFKTPLEIHCICSKIFCFKCLDEAHNPCSCQMLQEWRKKCADDSETLNWIKSNTRDCPKCRNATEKDGGCNHISCKCGAHWCWACGGNFTTETVYSHKCNQYLEKGGSDDGSQDTRASLERYLHYFNHYNAHSTSFKNQKRMERGVEEKISQLVMSNPSLIGGETFVEMEWLRKGLDVLFDTRRALMHSYVFAYYLFDRSIQQVREQQGKKKKKKKKKKSQKKIQNLINYFLDVVVLRMRDKEFEQRIFLKIHKNNWNEQLKI